MFFNRRNIGRWFQGRCLQPWIALATPPTPKMGQKRIMWPKLRRRMMQKKVRFLFWGGYEGKTYIPIHIRYQFLVYSYWEQSIIFFWSGWENSLYRLTYNHHGHDRGWPHATNRPASIAATTTASNCRSHQQRESQETVMTARTPFSTLLILILFLLLFLTITIYFLLLHVLLHLLLLLPPHESYPTPESNPRANNAGAV